MPRPQLGMAFAVTVLRCHVVSSKGSWTEEMNDFESYCLGLVLTHSSESDAGAEADGAVDRAGLGSEELVWAEQGKGM